MGTECFLFEGTPCPACCLTHLNILSKFLFSRPEPPHLTEIAYAETDKILPLDVESSESLLRNAVTGTTEVSSGFEIILYFPRLLPPPQSLSIAE